MNLGIFDLVGVIMLVLAGTSFVYLLRVKNKSNSTWMLLWFFLCVIFSSIATILTNLGTSWGVFFWCVLLTPTQKATNRGKLVGLPYSFSYWRWQP
jgi:hypothetical protein